LRTGQIALRTGHIVRGGRCGVPRWWHRVGRAARRVSGANHRDYWARRRRPGSEHVIPRTRSVGLVDACDALEAPPAFGRGVTGQRRMGHGGWVHGIREWEAMGCPRAGRRGRHVTVARFVLRPAAGYLAGLHRRGRLLGTNDAHAFTSRTGGSPPAACLLVILLALNVVVHWSLPGLLACGSDVE